MRRLASTVAVALSCLAGFAALSVGGRARAAAPRDADPSDAGPLKRIESPEGGWDVRLPDAGAGAAGREVELDPADAVTAGTLERSRLVFRARLVGRWRSPVRLSFHVQNRQGWYYQTVELAVVPHDSWRDIEVDFSPESADWEAVGHGRPWDELSARGIFRAGVRLFSELPYEGALKIGNIRWAPSRASYPERPPEILDLREPTSDAQGAVRAGGLWEMSFRVAEPVYRPFDAREANISCDVLAPDGSVESVSAFYHQEYMPGPGDELVAVGRPTWRVRYKPEVQGQYSYRLFVELGGGEGSGGESHAAEGWFTIVGNAGLEDPPVSSRATGSPSPPVPGRPAEPASKERWPADEEFVLSLDGKRGAEWRPELSFHPAVWRDGAFRRSYAGFRRRLWRVMLEWTRRWRRWGGLGHYDLELAWRFDRVVREAERRGVALPCAVLDDAAFLEHGTYRWPVNPLAHSEGGPLPGPGGFFTNDEARHYFLMRVRYMIARWGHSPAISSWCVASGLPASGVAEWHGKVGRALAELDTAPDRKIVSLHPFALPFRKSRDLGEFERHRPSGWELDRKDSPEGQLKRAVGRGEGGGDAVELRFPPPPEVPPAKTAEGYPDPQKGLPEFKWVTLTRSLDDNLFEYDYLTFDVRMPDDSPGVGRAQVIMGDRDLLWYECLLDTPLRAGDWTRAVLDLTGPAGRMTPVGHARPWMGWTRTRIRRIGIRVFPNGPVPAPALIDHVKLHAVERPARPLKVKVVRAGPEKVGRFERHEIVLDLGREFPNPFDPDIVAVEGIFRHEDGSKLVVPGFFYEPYARRLEPTTVSKPPSKSRSKSKRDVEVEVEVLEVTGAPDWRVRFAPTELGTYKVTIRVVTPEETVEHPAGDLSCVSSEKRGYVRVAKDDRYFEHSTGQVFYPLGPVIRSPTDTRDITRDPSIRKQAEAAGFRGTYQFDDYLKALSEGGGNWIRMWMCSWWCGLEWYRKWPGYGGAGWYNMPNAWRLDHVIESAERHGVYVQLCLQNHGQTSQRIDHEWEYHPYNRYEPEAFPTRHDKHPEHSVRPMLTGRQFLRPEGWLENAAQFFQDERARRFKRNLYRYIVARWGYSTNVFSWVLSSEVEFTGEYEKVQYRRDDRDLYYTKNWRHTGKDYAYQTLAYHKAMGQYLKKIDPWKHMVTTHFSHPHRGRAIWKLDEMDYSQANAYTGYARWRMFVGPWSIEKSCVVAPYAMDQYWNRFLKYYRKPVTIGEWGGYWMKNSVSFLDAELHTGTWSSIMTPMAGSTGFWWWTHVHFNEKYGVWGAVGRFLKGEDRRNLGLNRITVQIVKDDGSGAQHQFVKALALGNRKEGHVHRADIYVYHLTQPKQLDSAPEVADAKLVIPKLELKEGAKDSDKTRRYKVEIWDTRKGEVASSHYASSVRGEALSFRLPAFSGDVALKVRPLE
ncbi:MAG: hypothetical protein ACYTFI_05645 [Planctomycetota bacterium]